MEYVTTLGQVKADCLVIGFFEDEDDNQIRQKYPSLPLDNLSLPSQALSHLCLHYNKTEPMVMLVNCGKSSNYTANTLAQVSAEISKHTQALAVKTLAIDLPYLADKNEDLNTRLLVLALESAYYHIKHLKSHAQTPHLPEKICISNACPKAMQEAKAISHGSQLCKELADYPANVCTPSYLAQRSLELCGAHTSLECTILEPSAMASLGMNALLAVTQGSKEPARLIELNYQGGSKEQAPIVLVGKGVTFDSGGLSLKPPMSMTEMKYDMCGAATVLGVIDAIAHMQLPMNVIGLIPACENLPGPTAVKPGDVVTSMSGQTVEILNTDAEGRLILCDTLTYAKKFNPELVIDIATLTGAMIIALGHKTNGIMSNQDELAEQLLKAGQEIEDKAWQLPIWEEYQSLLDSNIADIANIGSDRSAGSITAACFLARFTKDYRWAHIDCAGTAWVPGSKKAATGRPVPLLCQFLLDKCS